MIDKIELPLLSLATLFSEEILFLFTELSKWANNVVSSMKLTERYIIWTVSPKNNRNKISKMKKKKLTVLNKSV